ncbi:MAG: hypothetical protein JO244_15505 [Solirubrobacterales bacterium]|nr:hypothetical protein [Solirubrobacterales bacterium]
MPTQTARFSNQTAPGWGAAPTTALVAPTTTVLQPESVPNYTWPPLAPGNDPRLCSTPDDPLCRADSIVATSSIQPENSRVAPSPTETDPVIGSDPISIDNCISAALWLTPG